MAETDAHNALRKGAIISGGMGGIGRAIATRLAADGFSVALLYNSTDKSDADAFAASLPGTGHIALRCDITKSSEVESAVMLANEAMQDISICIHAAVSPIVRKTASKISPEEFRSQFEVTAFGGFNLFHAVLSRMRERKEGLIIGLTTAALEENDGGAMAGYIAAKFALRGMLRELSHELEPQGVRVNAVAPGFVPTRLQSDLPEPVLRFITERAPTQSPEDVAEVVSFLCSDEGSGESGKTFSIQTIGHDIKGIPSAL
jgi:3-oxoacyl-[acyl-carrier protein] reductase